MSGGDFDRIELAPFAQCAFRGFRFEIVPAIEGVSSRQQGSKLPVGTTLAEHVSDLIEIIRQKFASKVQRQRLAETELSFVGDRDVVLAILDVIRKLIVQLVQIGEFGAAINLARPPAQDRLMQAGAAASNEVEREENFLKAGGHAF